MSKKTKDVFINVIIIAVIFLFIYIFANSKIVIYRFLSRYDDKLCYLLTRKNNSFLFKLISLIIMFIFCLPFYPYKIRNLFKYEKIDFKFFVRICLMVLSVNLFVIFIRYLPDVIKYFNFYNNGVIENTYHKSVNISIFNIIISGLITPIVEEIICRGIIYNRLKNISSVRLAIIFSSILFALLHAPKLGFNIVAILTILVTGAFLAYTYEKTKTIWTSIFLHSLINIFLLLTVLLGNKYSQPHLVALFLPVIIIPGIIIAIQEIKKYSKSKNIDKPITL